MSRLSTDEAKTLPIFKVWADGGKHPPVALDKPVCVIGRNEVGVNLPLHAPQVSKLHAVVVRTQRKVYVRDLASRNGVQRNGAPVQEVGLSDEDVLRIGSYTLRCSSGFGRASEADPDDTGAGAASLASTLPAAELVATNGQSYAFPTTHQTLLIGSRQGCEVLLDEEDRVAPVHAILFEMDGKRYVRELGAPGGTYLNDRPIHQAELTPGDALRVGNVTLTYALIDPLQDDVPSLDPIGISDSLSAPSISLVDSTATEPESTAASTPAVDPSVATADSMILPEITMEDSTAPAPAGSARPERPISEYDFDVVESDPSRESTFHGEVLGARPVRPELPPVVAGTEADKAEAKEPQVAAAPPAANADSAIPMTGPFHDKIIEDHLAHDEHDPEQTGGAMPMAGDAGGAKTGVPAAAANEPKPQEKPAEKPPEKRATIEAIGPEAEAETAAPPPPPQVPGVEAPAAAAVADVQNEAVQEEITQLVAEVNEQVAQVSEKVEIVAAKVERVTAKMNEVTREVSDVAETAGALQEAWSEFQGGESEPLPGTSENVQRNDQPKNRARRSKRKNRKQ